jgi:PKD repeat protein
MEVQLEHLGETLRELPERADDVIVSAISHPSALAGRLLAWPRRGLLLATVAALFFCAATRADAQVTTAGGQTYGVAAESEAAPVSKPNTPLTYGGGPVVHSSAPYAIFWDPGDASAGLQELTAGFMEEVGHASGSLENVFAVATQYRDSAGNAAFSTDFRGAYTDVDSLPASGGCSEGTPCLSDAQLRAELAHYITANELPAGLNPVGAPTPVYFLFTPPGVNVCLGGAGESGHCSKAKSAGAPICSYHSVTTVNSTQVLYAVVPLNATSACQDGTGLLQEPNKSEADVVVNQVADEQIATTTDPLLNGWRDETGAKEEVPDKCRNDFSVAEGSGGEEFNQTLERKYYLNDEFDQAALFDPYPGNPCIHEVAVQPKFTEPNPVASGSPVTFNSTESVVDLGIAKYRWDFGDGTTAEVNCGARTPTNHFGPAGCNESSGVGNPNSVASTVHRYTYGGTYTVTLTLTDDGENTASVSHEVSVVGPSRPAPAPPVPTPAIETTSASQIAASSAPAATNASPAATPIAATVKVVATQSVASGSLTSVLKNGLTVHYSVNQQVAGRFEVLLASSIAKRIGLHGASATSLAQGTPAQTVIAKAILVTTKAGRSTYTIKFSKATAARLRRLHKVSLMIRLVVHNGTSSTATTVLDTANLH